MMNENHVFVIWSGDVENLTERYTPQEGFAIARRFKKSLDRYQVAVLPPGWACTKFDLNPEFEDEYIAECQDSIQTEVDEDRTT